jgi:hypothetical protein
MHVEMELNSNLKKLREKSFICTLTYMCAKNEASYSHGAKNYSTMVDSNIQIFAVQGTKNLENISYLAYFLQSVM